MRTSELWRFYHGWLVGHCRLLSARLMQPAAVLCERNEVVEVKFAGMSNKYESSYVCAADTHAAPPNGAIFSASAPQLDSSQ